MSPPPVLVVPLRVSDTDLTARRLRARAFIQLSLETVTGTSDEVALFHAHIASVSGDSITALRNLTAAIGQATHELEKPKSEEDGPLRTLRIRI
jgi:hypothetical protein